MSPARAPAPRPRRQPRPDFKFNSLAEMKTESRRFKARFQNVA